MMDEMTLTAHIFSLLYIITLHLHYYIVYYNVLIIFQDLQTCPSHHRSSDLGNDSEEQVCQDLVTESPLNMSDLVTESPLDKSDLVTEIPLGRSDMVTEIPLDPNLESLFCLRYMCGDEWME